jgi:predicted esterase
MEFTSLQKKIFKDYFAGRYEDALGAVLEALELFPEFYYRTGFWAACLYCRTGRPDEAMKKLEEALEKGAWWGESALQDGDLKPLWERPDFERLKEICRERHAAAAKNSRPDLLLLEPENAGSGASLPLILALHGWGGEMRSFAARWDLPGIRDSYILAFPQSSQICGLNLYNWDNRELAVQEIGDVCGRLALRNGVGPKQTVVAGFSQGGTLAIILGSKLHCAGFIAIVPGVNDVVALVEQCGENKDGRRGCIITGDQDYGYTATVELAAALEQNGLPCRLLTVAGMGHEIPEDFPSLLRQAVNFVCAE